MTNNYVSLEDIPVGETREFEIGHQYITNLFGRRQWHTKGIPSVIKTMKEATLLTEREFAMDYYTSFSSSSYGPYQVSGDGLLVPSLGTQEKVYDPKLTGLERLGPELLVPLVHIHTHPGYSAYPSSKNLHDEGDFIHLLSNQTRRWSLGSYHFEREGSALHIIASMTGDDYFMWRLNNGKFPSEQLQLFHEFIREHLHQEEKLVDFLNNSGLITAYSHRGSPLSKPAIEEIAERFAPFTLHVKRMYALR